MAKVATGMSRIMKENRRKRNKEFIQKGLRNLKEQHSVFHETDPAIDKPDHLVDLYSNDTINKTDFCAKQING